jgi:hypothetical protein
LRVRFLQHSLVELIDQPIEPEIEPDYPHPSRTVERQQQPLIAIGQDLGESCAASAVSAPASSARSRRLAPGTPRDRRQQADRSIEPPPQLGGANRQLMGWLL